MTKELLEQMYKTFVLKANSEFEEDLFFSFFTFDEFDSRQEKKKNMIKGKIREQLFKSVLAQESTIVNCSMKAFLCFETNFNFVNQNTQAIYK